MLKPWCSSRQKVKLSCQMSQLTLTYQPYKLAFFSRPQIKFPYHLLISCLLFGKVKQTIVGRVRHSHHRSFGHLSPVFEGPPPELEKIPVLSIIILCPTGKKGLLSCLLPDELFDGVLGMEPFYGVKGKGRISQSGHHLTLAVGPEGPPLADNFFAAVRVAAVELEDGVVVDLVKPPNDCFDPNLSLFGHVDVVVGEFLFCVELQVGGGLCEVSLDCEVPGYPGEGVVDLSYFGGGSVDGDEVEVVGEGDLVEAVGVGEGALVHFAVLLACCV